MDLYWIVKEANPDLEVLDYGDEPLRSVTT